MAIVYGIILAVAAALLVLYCLNIRKKEPWLIVMYSCVCIVNLGYLLLSLSHTVSLALFATKLAYLGHIFLLISMFLTIAKISGVNYGKALPTVLCSLGAVVLGVVCTAGYLPWYYTSVRLEYADGAAKLVKEYGPLHSVYLIYVLAYFIMMIATIVWSVRTRRVSSRKHAALLAGVVLCNIAMWLIEKFVSWNFEFLSLSYILSEGMLFFLYWIMQDYVHKEDLPEAPVVRPRVIVLDSIPKAEKLERVMTLLPKGKRLTERQMEMLDGILDGKSQKEIAAELHISENTVKWHVGLLYSALGVGGKDELLMLLSDK